MSCHDSQTGSRLPPLSPLVMPTQDLKAPYQRSSVINPGLMPGTDLFRVATFAPAVITAAVLVMIFSDWFQRSGYSPAELAMLVMVGFSSFWISLSVAAATIGLFLPRSNAVAPCATDCSAINIALLIPIYNEDPVQVFKRLNAMRKDLSSSASSHRFSFFVLSDTRDREIAEQEISLFAQVAQSQAPCIPGIPVYYRRRTMNIERKTGNIKDWIENWGGNWPAFITLDADSLMSAGTIITLADELAFAPDTALIQTVPRLIGAETVFSRVQQFANNIYGNVLAKGLDRWSGCDGNYWGHNAIIRTKAFAGCAGLPRLSGGGALGGTIKSHDFVEAALLRRAGWTVRLLPELPDSFEETPQTIIDYVLRDRRWCQGNLQHLRLLATPGLTWASRFHMLQGAMAYIASIVWFMLLVVWVLMGRNEQDHVFRYFTDANPLFPQWPEMDLVSRMVVLCFMLGLLLIPKFLGILQTVWRDPKLAKQGGPVAFTFSSLGEIFLSFMLAPLLMVQHLNAVAAVLFGMDSGWIPQNRQSSNHGWITLLRFHWLETAVGTLLLVGSATEVISLLLLPIAISLAAAAPVSYFSGLRLSENSPLAHFLETEEVRTPSRILNCMAPQLKSA